MASRRRSNATDSLLYQFEFSVSPSGFIEQHRRLDPPDMALLLHGLPIAYVGRPGVVEHTPVARLGVLDECVVVQAVVAHHALQGVQVFVPGTALEDLRHIHDLEQSQLLIQLGVSPSLRLPTVQCQSKGYAL